MFSNDSGLLQIRTRFYQLFGNIILYVKIGAVLLIPAHELLAAVTNGPSLVLRTRLLPRSNI